MINDDENMKANKKKYMKYVFDHLLHASASHHSKRESLALFGNQKGDLSFSDPQRRNRRVVDM